MNVRKYYIPGFENTICVLFHTHSTPSPVRGKENYEFATAFDPSRKERRSSRTAIISIHITELATRIRSYKPNQLISEGIHNHPIARAEARQNVTIV